MRRTLCLMLLLVIRAAAQKPAPALPSYCTGSLGGPYTCNWNTAYSQPVGGATWAAHTPAQLTTALASSVPGDVIVLDAGTSYSGNFVIPAKANPNNKWIYIISSALANLPEGTRVDPSMVANMPTITAASGNPLKFNQGANHWRLAGLEVTTAAVSGTTELIAAVGAIGQTPSDSITVDRSYIHGSLAQDIRRGLNANITNLAVVDSYFSEIHSTAGDSQAICGWLTPGPIKITNNYLEAGSENVMFGGAGGLNDPWIPSDIWISGNTFYKPLSWISSLPNGIAKNLFELKSAQRVLVDGNTFTNSWVSAQTGYGINLTPRTNATGGGGGGTTNTIGVLDITLTNNVIKNVASAIAYLSHDVNCLPANGCTNPGQLARVALYNNVFYLGDTTQPGFTSAGSFCPLMISNSGPPLLDSVLFQHNSCIPPPNLGWCNNVIDISGTSPWTPTYSRTYNVWMIDNAMCRQLTGPPGMVGQFPYVLPDLMGDPAPPDPRLTGNVFFVRSGDGTFVPPANNLVSATVQVFDAQGKLTTPTWTNTTDGKQAGYLGPTGPAPTLSSIAVTPASPSIVAGSTLQFTATGTYSDGSTANLTGSATWGSGTPATATIAAGGLATAVAAGTTAITATSGAIVSPADTLTVTPSGPTLVSITISPLNAAIPPFATLQYTATCTWSDASQTNCTSTVAWTSSNTTVATISLTGLATANTVAGVTIIQAAYGAVSGSSSLSVFKICF